MTFLHPLLLWGTLLGSIPIIIHLLSRRRYRIMPWAAMEFLLAALSERSRNVRIQDLVLLALRVLVLVAAAGAVARPLLSPAAVGKVGLSSGGPDAVLIIDTSYSMQTNVAGQTRIDHARQRAHAALQALPGEGRVGVIYMDERATPATEGLITDRLQIAAAIDRAEPSALGSDAAPAIAAAIELLKESTATSKRIFLVTDAQAQLFERQASGLRRVLAEADPSVGFVVLPVHNAPVSNLALTHLAVKNRTLRVGTPVLFEAQVLDVGEPAAEEASIELWIDGRKIDRLTVPLAERRAAASFLHTFTAAGLYGVEVRLDPDAVEIDNHRYVAVAVPPSIDVAMVVPENEPAVGESAYVYVEAALNVAQPSSAEQARRRGGAAAFDHGWGPRAAVPHGFTLRPRLSRDRLALELDDSVQVVILADPGALPVDALQRLEAWVGRGGSMLISSGPESTATLGTFRSGQGRAGNWMSDLALIPREAPPAEGREPLQFDLDGSDSLSAHTGGALAMINLDSPGLREALARVNVDEAVTLEPSGDSLWSVAMRLTDGRPALLAVGLEGRTWHRRSAGESTGETPVPDQESAGETHVSYPGGGEGRLVLFTSSLDASWNDLPYRPAFVALLHDLLGWMVRHRAVGPDMLPGQTWSLMPPGDGRDAAASPVGFQVIGPGGEALAGEGFLEAAGDGLWQFDQTRRPGIYRLERTGPGEVVAPDALRAVAVNVDPSESSAAVWPPEQIRALFPQDRCEVIPPEVPIERMVLAGLAGSEIWPLLAALVLLMLVAEALLAYRFSFQKAAAPVAAPAAAPRASSVPPGEAA
jgi:hypothetical protein